MKSIYFKLTTLLLLITAISACQTTPKSDLGGDLGSREEQVERATDLEQQGLWLEASQAYQTLAENADQPQRSFFYIRAALMFYNDERYAYIEPFFDSLQETDILLADSINREIILAGSYFGIGKIYQSLANLPEIETIEDFRFKALALTIRSKAVLAIGKPMDSAQLRMQISQYLKNDNEVEKNHAFIWQALNAISESSIVRTLKEQLSSEMRGWLELNLIARRSNMLPAKIEPWINKWYQLYGEHPAGAYFAIGLLEESKQIYIQPAKIALMLPFSGRLENVSEAIQNGFLYAYYQDDEDAPALEVIDASTDPAEFNLQYQQAVQNGAELIVGPISKELINILQRREQLQVPTLTLNYGDDIAEPVLNLYQFGLRPEDEAEQIADFALFEGKHHAVTLVPDNEWGSRLQNAFAQRFEKLGGHVVGAEVYASKKNDFSTVIKKMLNLNSSNRRRTIIQQVIGEKVEFDPRRREDIDMIFIAANAKNARLIKPQLKFHHAQGVPVYATSHIASSDRNADNNRDLDQIQFVDIPWLLDSENNRDHSEVSQLWPNDSNRFGRLYALGIDAYRLIPSLRRLMIHPEESAKHYTGELSIDKDGRVRRELLMATYEKGLSRRIEPGEFANIEEDVEQ